MSDLYVLADGYVVPVRDARAWSDWFNRHPEERVVARDEVEPGVTASTVFLGLDHSFGVGPPVLWESMVFGPDDHPWSDYQDRYTSREAAEAGHQRIVTAIQQGESPDANL